MKVLYSSCTGYCIHMCTSCRYSALHAYTCVHVGSALHAYTCVHVHVHMHMYTYTCVHICSILYRDYTELSKSRNAPYLHYIVGIVYSTVIVAYNSSLYSFYYRLCQDKYVNLYTQLSCIIMLYVI